MTATAAPLKAPFPYFGGKSRVATAIWDRFGDVAHYVEPFAGSLAVLLGRPGEPGVETTNDADGMLANFWRALRADPEAVAQHADWPANEIDLTARHIWLVGQREDITSQLMGDPDWCDPKAAGWWVWGIGLWIGSGWCSGQGPWTSEDGLLVDLRLMPDRDAGMGVHRQLVHLGNAGTGVHRQLVHLGNASGGAGTGEQGLYPWFDALADRLRRVRVCCGDWKRVVTPAVLHPVSGVTAVFLDPPYANAERSDCYAFDDGSVAAECREWAIAHGDDRTLRIALCGFDTEHTMPASWTAMRWSATGGYGSQRREGRNQNRHRETIWFSPHCLSGAET